MTKDEYDKLVRLLEEQIDRLDKQVERLAKIVERPTGPMAVSWSEFVGQK
jgi:seryl-tRNA(Sec) selenium transferase